MALNSIAPSLVSAPTHANSLGASPSANANACTGLGSNPAFANLANELRAGVSDDANSIGMLSQLASTLGGLSVPSTESAPQAFRSYSSLLPPQSSSSSDTMIAGLIDDQASGDPAASIG